MSRVAKEATGTHLKYPFSMTGLVPGALASSTAFPTSQRVCVASDRLIIVTCSFPAHCESATLGALSTCCCCYVYSRNKRRIEHLETHGVPLRERVEGCNRECQWYLLFQCTGFGWAKRVRLSFSSPYVSGHRLWVSIGHLSVRCTWAVRNPW